VKSNVSKSISLPVASFTTSSILSFDSSIAVDKSFATFCTSAFGVSLPTSGCTHFNSLISLSASAIIDSVVLSSSFHSATTTGACTGAGA